ncbi:NfeD family protein [Phycicoccus endophyticus]|uniref:NfeD family protein n=1 Tax=Phycicoccus endophyticus TaxID=1690220 RepID=A0A7G9R4G0_9MICO|nr:NfeD family protein [Phycicoccus endophyticus]NHI18368.1 NfeD family protein [Phycicoccus endophyticus]QNN50485.1 NfeD family protein [Phycicoccus endophyticus]GGL24369.1 membrane protein [Phycicoccus endophyticus]
MDWLTDNAWLGWLGVALVLAAIEAATVDFVFLMFAGGALAGAVAAALGAPFFLQVVVAVVAAMLLLLVVRPMLRDRFMDSVTDHHIGAAGLVGREAWVLQAVTETDGRVKLAGETWSARLAEGGAAAGPGDQVRVIAIHGATAIVVPLPDPSTTPTT